MLGGVDTDNEMVYALVVMKYIRQTVVSSLIVALAFFTSWFCVSPMTAQAMEDTSLASPMGGDMTMSVPSVNASGYYAADNAPSKESAPVAAWNSCVFNCLNKTSQAVTVKKFSADSDANLLADIPYNQTFYSDSLVSLAGTADFFGTPPPAPDILSSVFKKE